MTETEPLLRSEFMHHKGAIAFSGVLTLTDAALSFEQRRIERIAGAEPWTLPINEVLSVRAARMGNAVTVQAATRSIKLSGRASGVLADRLQALLEQRQGRAGGRYEPGERVLLFGPGVLFRPSWLDASGFVELTTLRLRFTPSLSGRLLGPDARVDLKLADVKDVRLVGVRRILEVESAAGIRRIGGSLAAALLTTLQGIREETPGGPRSVVRAASLRRGRLAHPGQMVISPVRMRFVTTGVLDAMVGASADVDIELSRVTRVDVSDSSFDVQTNDAHHSFEMADAGDVLDTLGPVLARRAWSDEPHVSEQGAFVSRTDIDEVLAPWHTIVPEDVRARPRLAGPALLHIPGVRLKRFHVIQSAQAVIAVPAVGPALDPNAIVIKFDEGIEETAADAVRDSLELRTPVLAVRFLPRAGNAFVQSFWAGVPKPNVTPLAVPVRPREIRETVADGTNRRDSYRVILPEPDEASVVVRSVPPQTGSEADNGAVAEGTTLAASLLNVSATGLGIGLSEHLPVGAQLEVSVRGVGSEMELLTLQMQVIHTRLLKAGERPRYHGLLVIDGSVAVRARLQRLWVAYQQQEVARRNQLEGDSRFSVG